jgi:membrane-bound inhibitor of C-type lysozyme
MQHIMGTVTDSNIMVKAIDGTTQPVLLTGDTKYFAGTETITVKAIKVGDHVVIHATKTGDHFTAAEVKMGAMRMKGMPGE